MDRGRFHPGDTPFTRRERGSGYGGTDAREENKTVDLFCKFRTFRGYLRGRLKTIYDTKREREFRDEVDDIKYFLSVMSDMLADENHGAAAIQGFIDRIHEMIRKNPLSDGPSYESESEVEAEEPSAPRSPSPTEVAFDNSSVPLATARTIPLERERNTPAAPRTEFSYFDTIEKSIERIHDRRKPIPVPQNKNPWDVNNDHYDYRSPNQDIDMRSGSVFKPNRSNPAPGLLGDAPPSWQDNSNSGASGSSYRPGFGRGSNREDRSSSSLNYDDWNANQQQRSSTNSSNFRTNQGYRLEDRFSEIRTNDPWSEGGAYSRRPPPAQDFSRDYSQPDRERSFDRPSTYSREANYERLQHQEEALFERRPPPQQQQQQQLMAERRIHPSNSDGPVQIDYHHGADDQWGKGAPVQQQSDREREMRFAQARYESQQQQSQQPYMNQFGMNAVNPFVHAAQQPMNRMPVINPLLANVGMSHNNNASSIPIPRIPHHQQLNHQIRPTAAVISGHRPPLINQAPPYPYPSDPSMTATRSPFPSHQVPVMPPTIPLEPVYASSNQPPVELQPSLRDIQQRASAHFGRSSQHRKENKDNQNVPPPNQTSPTLPLMKTSTTPLKSPQESLIASNQLISERDPRLLNRNKKTPPSNTTSHLTSHNNESLSSSKSSSEAVKIHRGGESFETSDLNHNRSRYDPDPRIARKKDRDRNSHHRSKYSSDRNHSDRRRDDRSSEIQLVDKDEGRVTRVNLEDDLNSKRLDEVRNRVRKNLPSSDLSKSSKLQELRKQIEKEGFHQLGRKKNSCSFDEAIVVPLPETPTRSHPRDSSMHKSKSHESTSREYDSSSSQKDRSSHDKHNKERGRGRSPSKKNKTDDNRSKSRDKRASRGSSQKDVPSTSKKGNSSKSNKDASESTPKPAGFRIPKIKRPPPLPPPRSPSPDPPFEYNHTQQTPVAVNEPESDLLPGTQMSETFIRQFIRSEMPEDQAEKILNSESTMAFVKEKLKIQLQELYKSEAYKQATIIDEQAEAEAEARRKRFAETDSPMSPEPEVEVEEAPEIEPGGHKSRSPTKKRNSKRRSSLEKLHDALKEMRFDTMLPLGPRRCTQSESPTDENKQPSSDANLMLPPSIPAEKNKRVPSGTKGQHETSPIAGSSQQQSQESSEASTNAAGGKRGRKRKRKASKVKPNKKKKGPTTRAAAAVKTALKIQIDKSKPETATAAKKGKKSPPKKNQAAGGPRRVTRSMKGKRRIDLSKIKLELKTEPVDQNDDEFLNADNVADDEPEEILENDDGQLLENGDDYEPIGPPLSPQALNEELAKIHIDLSPLYDDMDDDRMSIDIKSEPGDHEELDIPDDQVDSSNLNEQNGEFESSQNSMSMQEEASSNEPENIEESIKIDVDTDYNTDLADFLPEIPTIESVCSVFEGPEPENSSIDTLLNQINQKEGAEEPAATSIERSNSTEIRERDCEDAIDWMVNEVEDLVPDFQNEEMDRLRIRVSESSDNNPCIIKESDIALVSVPDSERESVITLTDSEDEEPNDFFEQIDSSVKCDPKSIKLPRSLRKRDSIIAEDGVIITLVDSDDSEDDTGNPVKIVSQEEVERLTKECLENTDSPLSLLLAKKQEPKYEEITQNEEESKYEEITKSEEPDYEEITIDEHPIIPKEEAMDDDDESIAQYFDQPIFTPPQTSAELGHNYNRPFSQFYKVEPLEEGVEITLQPSDARYWLQDPTSGRVTDLQGTDLYKCANFPCDFSAPNSQKYKDHITSCPTLTDTKSFGCPHCDKRVKAVINLMEHLKTHGRKKQRCSLCPYKTWAMSELTRHMKSFHKVYNHKVDKAIQENQMDDPEYILFPKDVASRVSTVQKFKENYAAYADRLVFGPNEIDKIPYRQIFHTLAYCSYSECTYSSKVRVNFLRHLSHHLNAESNPEVRIPRSDPVNPVPCLDRKELMFDKMTNWAGSTHENKPCSANSDSSSLPQFVSEQFRYVCSVKGCEQITVDEYMLRTHMRTLHPEVELYKCPHCIKQEGTSNDKRNTVVVDKIGPHLKLHGPKLYRCAYCDAIHTQLTLMEKHIPEKHPERKPIHYLIRNLDSEGNANNRRNSSDENIVVDKWRCTLCTSKQVFQDFEDIKNHCITTHRVKSQFYCLKCKFNSDSDQEILEHVEKDHCKNDEEIPSCWNSKIMSMWFRNDFEAKPDDVVRRPIWRRTNSVKHIRGIFLDDSKEKIPKAEKEPIAKASSSAGVSNSPTKKQPKTLNNAAKNSTPQASEPKEYTCPKCNIFKTKNANNMRVHLYNELSYHRFRCTICNVTFITDSSLKGHIAGDHSDSNFDTSHELLAENPEIEIYVKNFFASYESINSAQDNAAPKQPMFICKHCNQECHSPHNLKIHVLAKHIGGDRYSCSYCNTSFWNESLAQKHILRMHPDRSVVVNENKEIERKLTPAFWSSEYGIPFPAAKRVKKDPPVLDNKPEASFAGGSSSRSKNENSGPPHLMKQIDVNNDDMLFDFSMDDDVIILDDKLELPANDLDNSDENFLRRFLEENSDNASGNILPKPSISQTNNAYAYKCFHCGENSLTVRGARSHWEKIHSTCPQERCNYYEYKTFTQENDLAPCIQLSCSFCDFTVSGLNILQDHCSSMHPDQTFKMKRKLRTGHTVYECAICFHETCSLQLIIEHHGSAHPDEIDPEYATYDIREKPEFSTIPFMGKLVEDTVKYGCDDPLCAFESDTAVESRNHMIATHGVISRKANIKYTRYVINPIVRVSMSTEMVEPNEVKQMFQCPVCDYKSEERQKLVTDHLNEHIHTYICPACEKSFRSYLDTKFHIRQQHANPHATPLINRDMVRSRERLESSIIQVTATVKGRRRSQHISSF